MAAPGPSAQRIVGEWVLENLIGSGSFAVVWKAHHATSRAAAAIKEINTEKLNKKLQESLASEIAVLQRTHHSNIVGMLDIIKEPGKIYLVLEFCGGGDLGHYLRRYGHVGEETARYFLRQLAEGLKVLRQHNLIHRDLKPQNLLLSDASEQPLLKIADFGFARNLQPQGLAETLCGSPLYMAPEILQFHKYDAKADLWSVGTLLFELLTGKPPFNGANHMQLLQNIERTEARMSEPLASTLSPACVQLVHQLLRRNPIERISFEEFFAHPFLAVAGPSGLPPSRLPVAPTSHSPAAQHGTAGHGRHRGGGAHAQATGAVPMAAAQPVPITGAAGVPSSRAVNQLQQQQQQQLSSQPQAAQGGAGLVQATLFPASTGVAAPSLLQRAQQVATSLGSQAQQLQSQQQSAVQHVQVQVQQATSPLLHAGSAPPTGMHPSYLAAPHASHAVNPSAPSQPEVASHASVQLYGGQAPHSQQQQHVSTTPVRHQAHQPGQQQLPDAGAAFDPCPNPWLADIMAGQGSEIAIGVQGLGIGYSRSPSPHTIAAAAGALMLPSSPSPTTSPPSSSAPSASSAMPSTAAGADQLQSFAKGSGAAGANTGTPPAAAPATAVSYGYSHTPSRPLGAASGSRTMEDPLDDSSEYVVVSSQLSPSTSQTALHSQRTPTMTAQTGNLRSPSPSTSARTAIAPSPAPLLSAHQQALPLLRALLQPVLSRTPSARQAAIPTPAVIPMPRSATAAGMAAKVASGTTTQAVAMSAAAAAAVSSNSATALSQVSQQQELLQSQQLHGGDSFGNLAPPFPSPPPKQAQHSALRCAAPPGLAAFGATAVFGGTAPATGSSPHSPFSGSPHSATAASVHQFSRLPENLDTLDLLQRVIMVLLEVTRGRLAAAAASEDDALLSGGQGKSLPAKSSTAPWSVQGGIRPMPAGAVDSSTADSAEMDLLALHLYCCRLVSAALTGPAAPTSDVGGSINSSAPLSSLPHPHPATSCQHSPSPLQPQQRSLLASHARSVLALGAERGIVQAATRLAGGRSSDCGDGQCEAFDMKSPQSRRNDGEDGDEALLPCGADVVYDSALRFGRAAAVDEMMGGLSRSVEGYAKAADLLLFLLTDVPQVHAVKPSLAVADHQRLHRYYAAVRVRQAHCMQALNARMQQAMSGA